MCDSTRSKTHHHQQHRLQNHQHRRRSWCCSFTVPPHSPENPTTTTTATLSRHPSARKTEMPSKSSSTNTNNSSSFPNSPQKPSLVGRILSPGRVSPIPETQLVTPVPPPPASPPNTTTNTFIPKSSPAPLPPDLSRTEDSDLGIFDVRLNLKGKNGGGGPVVLELSSKVLSDNSAVFADLIADYRKNSTGVCRIEVPEVENLNVFRETIELMFEDDVPKRLIKIGVYRVIDMLEVSVGIKFTKGILSCLKYLEAVPWTEEEEQKLRTLFMKLKFDDVISKDLLARLYAPDSADFQQTLSRQLVWSITRSVDANARNELKCLVKGLLCRSSVYEKDHPDVNKEDMLAVCQSCLDSLITLFQEASGTNPSGDLTKKVKDKPLIECISKQVDNINWLLDILLDHHMAEDFIDLWTDQKELLRMHAGASPMIRYELSRVSAMIFIAMGTRKLHCRSESRIGFIQAWFDPMLLDFGWLQRCRKGLDMKALEEAMGQTLLTLPLKEQYVLFMEWFRCFSKHGTECPNLSKSFQIWWRRSFLRGSETRSVDSR